jgi:hypothetical protein
MVVIISIFILLFLLYLGLKILLSATTFLEKSDKLTRKPKLSRKLRIMLTGDNDEGWIKIAGVLILIYSILGLVFLIFKFIC